MHDLPTSQLVVLDSRLTSKYGTHYDDCVFRGPRRLIQLIRELERTETAKLVNAETPVQELTDPQW